MEENKRLSTRSGYCQGCACVICMTSPISWPNCVFAVGSINMKHIRSSCSTVEYIYLVSALYKCIFIIQYKNFTLINLNLNQNQMFGDPNTLKSLFHILKPILSLKLYNFETDILVSISNFDWRATSSMEWVNRFSPRMH